MFIWCGCTVLRLETQQNGEDDDENDVDIGACASLELIFDLTHQNGVVKESFTTFLARQSTML